MHSLPQRHAAPCPFRLAAAVVMGAVIAAAPALTPPATAADAVYRQPPPAVAAILTAPRTPRGSADLSPDGRRLVLTDPSSPIDVSVLAEPVEKLAGYELLTSMWCSRTQIKTALPGFSIATVANGQRVRAALPAGARIGSIVWSKDGQRLACVLYNAGGGQLWVVDAHNGAARRIPDVALHTGVGVAPEWMLDNRTLLCALVPGDRRSPRPPARVPQGPTIRIGAGRAAAQRTSRDVLKDAADQERYEWATRVQLARVPVDGASPIPLGPPGMFVSWKLSPEDRHVVIERTSALPLAFPAYLFPGTVEIWTVERPARVAVVGEIPFDDRSTISSVASLGPRQWTWGRDGRSLWYCAWEDRAGADAARAIRDTTLPPPGSDALMRLDAPFTGAARVVLRSEFEMRTLLWTDDGARLLVRDAYDPRRHERWWWIVAAAPATRTWLVKRSTEGVYDRPGVPMTHRPGHDAVAWTHAGGAAVYFAGEGFRLDGQRPFLDRVDLASGGRTRVFESASTVLESVQHLLAGDARQFITSRQTRRETPNWFVRTAGSSTGRVLSSYKDPTPLLSALKRTQFTFTRDDSVKLNAEVVLPATWKGERLPTIFWIYPRDYRSADAASQNRRSPNQFPSQRPLNPEVLVTQGYAVVYPDLAVVGTNDRYVAEISRSAKAAVDECVRRGFTDRGRIGVGGHSYGAFSTANLLAHTDLFRAGIASEGAYNRTLTPFTFQAEERSMWQARDTYVAMSPFMAADRIQEPLLLLHDLDDTNVGTHPIQSERMYEALNGMGRTVELILYPYENHVPQARESVLDYWSRVIEWFDRHVKNAPAARAQPAP